MTASNKITDYFGYGLAAARPSAPSLAAGCLGLWFSTDTDELDIWDGSTWTVFGSGAISTIGAGLTLTSGTLIAEWQAGSIAAVGHGLAINSGSLVSVGEATLNGTNGGTVTIAPASGVSDIVVNCPSGGGTITLAASPAFPRQRVVVDIVIGATATVVDLNAGFVFGTGIASYTPSTGAGDVDRLMLLSPDGTKWAVLAINTGFAL